MSKQEFVTEEIVTETIAAADDTQALPAAPGADAPPEPAVGETGRRKPDHERFALPGFIIAVVAAVLAVCALSLSVIAVSSSHSRGGSDRVNIGRERIVFEEDFDGSTTRGDRGSGRGRGETRMFDERVIEERSGDRMGRGSGSGFRDRERFEEFVEEDVTGSADDATSSTSEGTSTD